MKKRNNMANNSTQANIDLPTKAWINVNKNIALVKKLMEKNSELTERQKSWVTKILGSWWRWPRWGSTNATRPNPIMGTLYPMSHWQWPTVDEDSWQVNNAFNARTRLPNWNEIKNNRYANWEPVESNRPADDRATIPAAWLAKLVWWPLAYTVLNPVTLPIDAIWTVYATLRNWYNAIADFHNKLNSEKRSGTQYQKTLDSLRDSLKEAEEAKQRIDEYDKAYKEYMRSIHQNPKYSAAPADEYMSYSEIESRPYTFEDYIKDRNDTDILNYIEKNIQNIPDKWTDVNDEWKTNWETKLWKATVSQVKNALWHL